MVSSLSPSTRGLGAWVSALHRLRVGLVAGAPVLAHAELLHAAGHHALALAAGHLLGGVARVLARLALRQVVCIFGVVVAGDEFLDLLLLGLGLGQPWWRC